MDAPNPSNSVPTAQRSINGAVLSGSSLIVYQLVSTYFQIGPLLATLASLFIGSCLATLSAWAREALETAATPPPIGSWRRLGMMLAARIG